jgi:hypothetical protein
MNENMKRKNFHLTVAEEKIIYDASLKHHVSEAEIVRMAIQEFGAKQKITGNSLLQMANEASKQPQNNAPKNLSEDHDFYLTEGGTDVQNSK